MLAAAVLLQQCHSVGAQVMEDMSNSSDASGSEGCSGSVFLSSMCLGDIDHHPAGVLLEIFIFVMSFLALAIVCDDYLVLSLETLCVRWSIRDDVAGSTFMAFGSAAPEIIVNAVATIKSGSGSEGSVDQGISAILGSGMIAFMLIPGFCGLFGGTPTPLQLKRRPLLRDITAYSIGLVEVCVFFQDHVIQTHEASIMIGTYVCYILIVVFSPKARKYMKSRKAQESSENMRLLDDDVLGGTPSRGMIQDCDSPPASPIKGLGVKFFSKKGDSVEFPTSGPLLILNGEDVPNYDGVAFILGSDFSIAYKNEKREMQQIVLGQKGCERVIAKVERLMQNRDIETTKEWMTGVNVSAYTKGEWVDATVVAKSDGIYTVRFGNEAADLPFSDIRPLRDSGDDSLASMSPATGRDVLSGKKKILREAAEMGAITSDMFQMSMEDLSRRHGAADDDSDCESDATTNCTALSNWRRHWWRERDANEPDNSPTWFKYFSFLSVFVTFWQVIFKYTIPAHEISDGDEDDQKLDGEDEVPSWKKNIYPVTFLVSFVWVAFFSFIISNVAGRWADLSGLGQGFMGLLLISVGAEIPDCIQSVTVAKRGHGSMAVSNAIGSQNVNIFIGLGLPWFFSNIAGTPIQVTDVDDLRAAAYFDVGGVALNIGMLLVSAVYLGLNKATLGRKKGMYLIAAYFVVIISYATYSTIQKH